MSQLIFLVIAGIIVIAVSMGFSLTWKLRDSQTPVCTGLLGVALVIIGMGALILERL